MSNALSGTVVAQTFVRYGFPQMFFRHNVYFKSEEKEDDCHRQMHDGQKGCKSTWRGDALYGTS
jgi:hypothetical protein